jgi:hypothetical protein
MERALSYILVSSILALGFAGGCSKPSATESSANAAQTGGEEEIVTEDVNRKQWVTPDVAEAEEEEQEAAGEDVDEGIIEYGPSPDME